MNINIPHDVFLKALEKGGLAVFGSDGSDEGLREAIPTQRCVKLTAKNGKLTIESSVNKANSIYSCTPENMKVIKEGELCLDAVELRQELKYLQYAHTVFLELDESTVDPMAGTQGIDSIIPIGKVYFSAMNEAGRCAFKAPLTAYSPNDFVQTSYSDTTAPVLTIQSKPLCDAIDFVSFASCTDRVTELFDHICILSKDGKTHVAATDNRRAALTTLDTAFCEGETTNHPILVDVLMARSVISQMPDDSTKIEIILDQDDEHVTFRAQDFKVRVSMPPSSSRTKFPSFASAINMPIGASIVFNSRRELGQSVARLSAKDNVGVFTVETGSEIVGIKLKDFDLSGEVGCQAITKGLKSPISLGLKFIEEILKNMPDGSANVKFSFSNDEKKVIVQSVESPTPFYLMQRVTPTDI